MSDFGLYVHIPFCRRRCPYCAFVSVVGREDWQDRYVAAVCAEIQRRGEDGEGRALDTVFFGGGTPSLLRPGQLERILRAAESCLGLHPEAEITIEVNPGTVDQERFQGFREVGGNRLSLGVQSFCDEILQRLGRVHGAAEGEQAYAMARRAGFERVSFDLIFSIPGAAAASWRYTVERAVQLGPEHLSTYALTIEEGTEFARRLAQGSLSPVDEDEDAQTYEWTVERLTRAGYEQYEVSNFAQPGHRCRHNWGCWTGGEYLGVGVAAHSFLEGRRSWNVADLEEYLLAVETGRSPGAGGEVIDPLTALRERVWMGLRTAQGIGLGAAERLALQGDSRVGALQAAGHLTLTEDRLRLTRSGLALADAVGIEIAAILERARGKA